jgi:hypothetical protein
MENGRGQISAKSLHFGFMRSGANRGAATRFAGAPRFRQARGLAKPPGEAVHETPWGTLAGAWEAGERAAEAALKRLGRR